MAINTQELVKELQVRHQVGLKPNDPIFVLLTMNELLLANYQEQFQAMLETQGKQQDIQAEEAIKSHLKGSTDLSNRLFKAMHEDFEKTKTELKHLLQGQLNEIKQAKDNAYKEFNAAAKALQTMCYIVALMLGALLGFIFRGFLPH
jgi:molecular chaperone DnaK (HSP70)